MDNYTTPEAVLELSKIDPELEEFLKHSPVSQVLDFESATLEQLRKGTAAIEKLRYDTTPTYGAQESTITIPMRDGHPSEIRIVKPATAPAEGSPLVVLMFGGAFAMGSNLQCVPVGREIAAVYGATIASLSYRVAPEHTFPIAPNDIWDSLLWLSKNASSLGADLSRGFVVGGGSAGGNLASVVAQRSLKENLFPPLTGIWSFIPALLHEKIVPKKYKHLWLSREQNAKVPGFGAAEMKATHDRYKPVVTSEDYSPFNSDISWSGIPRTYVQVCGMDPLRDDGLIYEKVLRENGVETRLDVYPGVPHGHYVTFPTLKQSGKFNLDTIVGLGWLLRREVSREDIDQILSS